MPNIIKLNEKYFLQSADVMAEIGDVKKSEFYPQVKLTKWNNEVNFSVRYSSEIADASHLKNDTNVVEWIGKDNVKVKMYEVADPNNVDATGFEFEFELPIKPLTNTFDLSIKTKGLTFFYQKELTQKEIELGIFRPDNVIGSYAVYHDSKVDNGYKAGKAFHIYRPKAIDKYGKEIWCDMHIDVKSELLTITVPQQFLDSAAYPVIVDPTIGYSTVGATEVGCDPNQCYAFIGTSSAPSATIDKMTAYLKKSASGTSPYAKAIIFNGTTGYIPIQTNGVTPEVSIASTTAAWIDLPYSSKPVLSSGNGYRFGLADSATWPQIVLYYDGDADVGIFDYASPGSWAADYGEHANFRISLYATYTDSSTFLQKQYWFQSGGINLGQG